MAGSPSSQSRKKTSCREDFEGIRYRGWDKWEDRFGLTMGCLIGGIRPKRKRLLRSFDVCHRRTSSELFRCRYVNALSVFLTGVFSVEYGDSRATHSRPGVRRRWRAVCCRCKVMRLRHVQTQISEMSIPKRLQRVCMTLTLMHDRVLVLRGAQIVLFDDARVQVVRDFLTGSSFLFRYSLTNLLLCLLCRAAYNGIWHSHFGSQLSPMKPRIVEPGLE